MSLTLTVHRGTREIDGSCIEIAHPDGARLVLDAGRPLDAPVGASGLLPASLDRAKPATVLVSHPHQDHHGLLHELPEDWVVWTGQASARLISITDKTAKTPAPRELRTWTSRSAPLRFGPFTVTPILTDHSAFDAYIALLVCRHTTAARYAEELRARGVPVHISEDGWAQSPVVTAARAALAFAANPADIHSGLLLRTLGPDPLPLQAALSAQIKGRLADDPLLIGLGALSTQLASLPVGVGLDLVLSAADLRLWADRQRDAAQSRADLLRLEAEAEAGEFEAAHRDLKAASGFLGETAKVFLGWLDARANERDFDRRPDPSANSAEAVEIVTWHASKGRDWPITVVAEFDHGIEEWPGSTATRFDTLDRLDDMAVVLGSAALIHTPGFAAPEAERRFIEDRRPDFEANAKNLLYVALTRARDRLVLEWPAFLKDREDDAPGAKNLFHILADRCAPQITGGCLRIGGADCPAFITQLPEQASFTEYATGATALVSRFGPATALPAAPLTPWRLQPSQTRSAGAAPETRSIDIGAPWPKTLNDATRGRALHLALRTCLTRPELIPALAAATGLEETTIMLVSERAEMLRNWLAAEGYTDLQAEIPVLGFSPEGAEIPGTIDLLAVGSGGCILIDHKSGGGGEGFGSYWPQLSSYSALVAKQFSHLPLQGVAVFWIDHGRLELAEQSKPGLMRASDERLDGRYTSRGTVKPTIHHL